MLVHDTVSAMVMQEVESGYHHLASGQPMGLRYAGYEIFLDKVVKVLNSTCHTLQCTL